MRPRARREAPAPGVGQVTIRAPERGSAFRHDVRCRQGRRRRTRASATPETGARSPLGQVRWRSPARPARSSASASVGEAGWPSTANSGARRAAPAIPMLPQERLQQEGKRMRVSATPKANTSLRASASATTGEAGEAEHREARARREAPATWAVPQHRARREGKRTAPGGDAIRETPPVRPDSAPRVCPAAGPCRPGFPLCPRR